MSTGTFTSFAIAGGSGLTGSGIIKNLSQNPEVTILLLTRKGGSAAASKGLGSNVTVKEVDYEDESSLAAVLKGTQVVIACLTSNGLIREFKDSGFAKQWPLARASKAAGVSLFVPSEFGRPTEGMKANLGYNYLSAKSDFQDYLKSIDLPYARFYTGAFMDSFLGNAIATNTFTVLGQGNVANSWTFSDDVTSFISKALSTLPASQLLWSTFRVEGDRKSIKEIIPIYRQVTGKEPIVVYKDVDELKRYVEKDPEKAGLMAFLVLGQATLGTSVVTRDLADEDDNTHKLSNGLIPDWKPKDIRAFLSSNLKEI